MRSWITRSLVARVSAFLVVLFVAEVGARALEPRVDWDSTHWAVEGVERKFRHLREREDLEAVFLGSSLVQAGVDPTKFAQSTGLCAYNAALPGAQLRRLKPWAQEIVVPEADPKVVVLGVSIRDTNDNAPDEADLSAAFVGSPGFRAAAGHRLSVIEALERASFEASAFIRTRENLRTPVTAVKLALGQDDRELTEEGLWTAFASDSYRTSAERREGIRLSLTNYSTGRIDIPAAIDLVVNLRAEGRELLLVAMPTLYRELLPLLKGGMSDLHEYERALSELAAGTGLALLRADQLITASADFADEYHLNALGSDKLTDLIAERVRHRGRGCSR